MSEVVTRVINFDEAGNITNVVGNQEPSPQYTEAECTTPHKCPRCKSYFYGKFGGFDDEPFLCGNCGFTYPPVTLAQLRGMHEKNGTLAKFDKGELVEDAGSIEIFVDGNA